MHQHEFGLLATITSSTPTAFRSDALRDILDPLTEDTGSSVERQDWAEGWIIRCVYNASYRDLRFPNARFRSTLALQRAPVTGEALMYDFAWTHHVPRDTGQSVVIGSSAGVTGIDVRAGFRLLFGDQDGRFHNGMGAGISHVLGGDVFFSNARVHDNVALAELDGFHDHPMIDVPRMRNDRANLSHWEAVRTRVNDELDHMLRVLEDEYGEAHRFDAQFPGLRTDLARIAMPALG